MELIFNVSIPLLYIHCLWLMFNSLSLALLKYTPSVVSLSLSGEILFVVHLCGTFGLDSVAEVTLSAFASNEGN